MATPELPFKPNANKNLIINVGDRKFARYPVKTRVITESDTVENIIKEFVPLEKLMPTDIVAIGHKITSLMQHRAFHKDTIKVSPLAKFLVKFVYKPSWGVGIGNPVSMQLAINEAGTLRLLFAGLIGSVAKIFGVRGVFYRLVGKNIVGIDGPVPDDLPEHRFKAYLPPKDGNDVCAAISKITNTESIIIDANDIGSNVFGYSSSKIDFDSIKGIFKDNPMGQSTEQTPIVIIREIKS